MDDTNRLVHSTDGALWASEFCRIVGADIPALRDREDQVRAWFANAIMAGWDDCKNRGTPGEGAAFVRSMSGAEGTAPDEEHRRP